jgi:hypothetical protein
MSRIRSLIWAAVFVTACAREAEKVPAASQRPVAVKPVNPAAAGDIVAADGLRLQANTQATLDGVRIGAGNFWEGEYQLATGEKKHGRTAGIWVFVQAVPLAQEHHRVGVGSKLAAGNLDLEVIEVTRDTVRLRILPRP